MSAPFWVFCGDEYYPSKGIEDFIGTAETYEQALELVLENKSKDWFQIAKFDGVKFEIVQEGSDYGKS